MSRGRGVEPTGSLVGKLASFSSAAGTGRRELAAVGGHCVGRLTISVKPMMLATRRRPPKTRLPSGGHARIHARSPGRASGRLTRAGPIERFAAARCEVLLLGGAKSTKNLKASLDGLSAILPKARRVTLPGVGHEAALDTGEPEPVAEQLRTFFRT